jgi:hypothetical protein
MWQNFNANFLKLGFESKLKDWSKDWKGVKENVSDGNVGYWN